MILVTFLAQGATCMETFIDAKERLSATNISPRKNVSRKDWNTGLSKLRSGEFLAHSLGTVSSMLLIAHHCQSGIAVSTVRGCRLQMLQAIGGNDIFRHSGAWFGGGGVRDERNRA